MTEKDQELMKRYIYQVVRRLPQEQKKEVSLELQELITDMIEEKGISMEEALAKLGDPARLAERYQDASHCLIGPEYYDTYRWFVKIVLLCSMIPVFLTGSLDAFLTGGTRVWMLGDSLMPEAAAVSVIFGVFGAALEALAAGLIAFGAVTFVFVILERQKVKLEKKAEKEWKVGDLEESPARRVPGFAPGVLPSVASPKARISRGDCIVEIVFTVIFGVLLVFAPHFFSAVLPDGDTVTFIPLFNLEQWPVLLPFFVLSLFAGLVDDAVRLAVGVYGKVVLVSSLICNGVSLALSVILLKALPFWNPNFAADLGARLSGDEELLGLLAHWDGGLASNLLLAVILFAVLLDTGTVLYKTLRYGAL